MNQLAKWMIFAGGILVIAGVIFYLFNDKLNWIGKLPGDFRIERENFKFYFPITTSILVSLLLSLIMYIFRKYF